MLLEKSGKMVKAHIRYMNESGKRVPGVTTLIGILNKPALVPGQIIWDYKGLM